jgi:hypothetical protein
MPNTEARSDRIGSPTSSISVVSSLRSSTGTAPVHQGKKGPPPPLNLPPSPADSDMSSHEQPSSPRTTEETRLTRNIDRGAPGDQAIFSENKSPRQREIARKRSQYYGDAFAAREPISSARERVSRDSMVLAEIKTNVIVGAPFKLLHGKILMPSRYKMNTASLPICPTASRRVISGPNPLFWSRLHIRHAWYLEVLSTRRTR